MALLGGVLTIVFGGWHVMRRQKDKLAIPYGVAIACAGLWASPVSTSPHRLSPEGCGVNLILTTHGLSGPIIRAKSFRDGSKGA
jgi:hypothetical protein